MAYVAYTYVKSLGATDTLTQPYDQNGSQVAPPVVLGLIEHNSCNINNINIIALNNY